MRAAKFTAAIAALCALIAIAAPSDPRLVLSRSALDIACAVGIALAVWSHGRWGKVAAVAGVLGAAFGLLAPVQITGDARPLIAIATEVAWLVAAIALVALAGSRLLTVVGGLFMLCDVAFTTQFALDRQTACWLAAGAIGRLLLLYAVPARPEVPASDDAVRAFAWTARGAWLRVIGVAGAVAGYRLGGDSALAMVLGAAWVGSFACTGIGALRLARTREDYAPQVAGTASLMALGYMAAASLRFMLHIPISALAGELTIALITADLALLTSIARIDDRMRSRVRWLRWAYLPMLCVVGMVGQVHVVVASVMLAIQLSMAWASRTAGNAIEPGLPPARIQS